MKSIIRVEGKRILTKGSTTAFFTVVVLLSVFFCYRTVKGYERWNETGMVISGFENLNYGKANIQEKSIEGFLTSIRESDYSGSYIEVENAEMLVDIIYDGKQIKDLSDDEIKEFYSRRLYVIKEMLDENSRIRYTKNEKKEILGKAGTLTDLTIGYSEGWKAIDKDLGLFISILLVMISIVIIPLFASGSQTKMKELCESTKNGKLLLDKSRIIVAFSIAMGLYLASVMLFFAVYMLTFGIGGGTISIQSKADTFFSLYHITFLQQFFLNVLMGVIALLFIVCLTILISTLVKGIMSSISIIIFFWILLIIMEQMSQYPVNHWFANFMPLRMSSAIDFYLGMEIYRIGDISITSIIWCPFISSVLSIILLSFTIISYLVNRKKYKFNR